jgi:hypothetical protein
MAMAKTPNEQSEGLTPTPPVSMRTAPMRIAVTVILTVLGLAAFSGADAKAEFSCIWEQGYAPDCTPNPSGSEDFPIRLRMTRALFEAQGCEVTEIKVRSDGKAEWTHSTYPDPIVINIAYKCTDARAKPMAIVNRQYALYCPEKRFTLYHSASNCDSRGMCQRHSSSPDDPASKPSSITDADQNTAALHTAWCEPSYYFNGPG